MVFLVLLAPLVPQLTESRTAPSTTSTSRIIARRFLPETPPATTIPNMPTGKIEAKIGRGPCLSSVVLGRFWLLLPEIASVIFDVGLEVPSIANEAGDAVQVAPAGAVHVRASC